ncbi:MAG: 3-oxoacyl-ACP reductase FabG [Bacteroidaceae bacterium]|nr:3-oxoacyl-ACP reductase FabG [Bacteroidaceae bacterium]MBQ8220018.1 3-oxoacyl-ACP reductase FabG [Bacteroidaceae bacterium]
MKYALVTGGSRGIGRAVCLQLAKDGFAILINYRSAEQKAIEVKQLIEAEGGVAELLPFDVSDKEATHAALEAWAAAHGKDDYIDVLVNNAGMRSDAVLLFMEDAQWHNVINTTLDGFYHVTQPVLKRMARKRHGRIINMASVSGIKGLPGQCNYSAAKGALIATTKALALEVANRNITVNAIAPGFIATDMTEGLDEESLKQGIPMGRFGSAEEVAHLVSFLASEHSSYITGEVISINGGLYT